MEKLNPLHPDLVLKYVSSTKSPKAAFKTKHEQKNKYMMCVNEYIPIRYGRQSGDHNWHNGTASKHFYARDSGWHLVIIEPITARHLDV